MQPQGLTPLAPTAFLPHHSAFHSPTRLLQHGVSVMTPIPPPMVPSSSSMVGSPVLVRHVPPTPVFQPIELPTPSATPHLPQHSAEGSVMTGPGWIPIDGSPFKLPKSTILASKKNCKASRLASDIILELSLGINNMIIEEGDKEVTDYFVSLSCEDADLNWKILSKSNCKKSTLVLEHSLIYWFKFNVLEMLKISICRTSDKSVIGECVSGFLLLNLIEKIFSSHELIGGPLIITKAVIDKQSKTIASIKIMIEESTNFNDLIHLEFSGKITGREKLDRSGQLYRESAPSAYLVISKQNKDGIYDQVYVTEHRFSNCNPKWNPFTLCIFELTGVDFDTPLKIECFDWSL